MASVKKAYTRTKLPQTSSRFNEPATKASFINDLLAGTIQATHIVSVRDAQGRLVRVEYDDPD